MANQPTKRACRKAGVTRVKALGKNGFTYREQYGVIVMCGSEKHQAQTYDDLRQRGLRCKVVTV